MLSRDLRTLGAQLHARNLEGPQLTPADIDGVIACLRDMERRAMALEAQPAPAAEVIHLADRRAPRSGRTLEEKAL